MVASNTQNTGQSVARPRTNRTVPDPISLRLIQTMCMGSVWLRTSTTVTASRQFDANDCAFPYIGLP